MEVGRKVIRDRFGPFSINVNTRHMHAHMCVYIHNMKKKEKQKTPAWIRFHLLPSIKATTSRACWHAHGAACVAAALLVSVLLSPLQITVTLILIVRLMMGFFCVCVYIISSVMLLWLTSLEYRGGRWPFFKYYIMLDEVTCTCISSCAEG